MGTWAAARRLIAATAVVAGCSLLPFPGAPTTPRPCSDVYGPERCEAIHTAAAEQIGVSDAEVHTIEVLPDPTPRPDGVLDVRSGGPLLRLRVHTADRSRDLTMCAGVSGAFVPACMDQPSLTIASPLDGYRDVPCAGEPPAGCASPVPAVDPDALTAAEPLQLERLSIEVPRVGPHEISLGLARLPNGILTTAQAHLVDSWPDGVRVSSEGIRLDVRSTEPGRPPFRNVFEHGWWPGTEQVEVLLVFEARHVDPGATIELSDILIR